ncbi:MAG: DUF3108 domain-containing protein [Planctomycetota bacterium]
MNTTADILRFATFVSIIVFFSTLNALGAELQTSTAPTETVAPESPDYPTPPENVRSLIEFQTIESPLTSQYAETIKCPPFQAVNLSLTQNETLTYDMKALGMVLGQTTLEVLGLSLGDTTVYGLPAPQVYSLRQTMTLDVNLLVKKFKSRISIDTDIDARQAFMRRATMVQDEEGSQKTLSIQYYPADEASGAPERYVYIEDYRSDEKGKRFACSTPLTETGPGLDIVSVLYYIRGIDLEPGDSRFISVYADGRLWKSEIAAIQERRGPVMSLGNRTLLDIEIRGTFKGIFSRGGKLKVSIDKETKIPVLFELDLPVVTGTIELRKTKNSALR